MNKKYKMDRQERENELKSRILREDVPPVLIGNGVHREEKNEAQKIANDQTLKRAQQELEDQKKNAMKPGKMIRSTKTRVTEN